MNRYELKSRFSEPSTWASLAVVTGLFGIEIAPEVWAHTATGIMAALAIFIPEKGGKNE